MAAIKVDFIFKCCCNWTEILYTEVVTFEFVFMNFPPPPAKLLLRYCRIRLNLVSLTSSLVMSEWPVSPDCRHRTSWIVYKILFSLWPLETGRCGRWVKGHLVWLYALILLDLTTTGKVKLWNWMSEELSREFGFRRTKLLQFWGSGCDLNLQKWTKP